MSGYIHESDRQIDDDQVEIEQLEQLLYQLPDHAIAGRSGKVSATEYRMRVTAALRAMTELLGEIKAHPPGVTRAKLVAPLARWRDNRRKYTEIVRRARRGPAT